MSTKEIEDIEKIKSFAFNIRKNILEMALWFETLMPERYKIFYDQYGDIEHFYIYRTFEVLDEFIKN